MAAMIFHPGTGTVLNVDESVLVDFDEDAPFDEEEQAANSHALGTSRAIGTILTEHDALGRIFQILDGTTWSPATLDLIADELVQLGYEISEPE